MTYLRLVFNWLWKFIKQLLCFLDQFKTKIDFQFSSNQSNPVSLFFRSLGRLSFRRFHFSHDVESISRCAYWSRLQIHIQNMFLRFYFVLCPLVNIMHQNPHYVNILILFSRFPVNWKAFDLSSSIKTSPQMWQWLRPCSGVGAYWEGFHSENILKRDQLNHHDSFQNESFRSWLTFFFSSGHKAVI